MSNTKLGMGQNYHSQNMGFKPAKLPWIQLLLPAGYTA